MSTACSLLAGNDLRAGCTPFGKVDKSHVTGLFWVENSILMANVMSDRLLEVDNINVQVQCVKRTRAAGRQVGNDMTFVHFSPSRLSSGRQQFQRRKVDKSHVNDLSAANTTFGRRTFRRQRRLPAQRERLRWWRDESGCGRRTREDEVEGDREEDADEGGR